MDLTLLLVSGIAALLGGREAGGLLARFRKPKPEPVTPTVPVVLDVPSPSPLLDMAVALVRPAVDALMAELGKKLPGIAAQALNVVLAGLEAQRQPK